MVVVTTSTISISFNTTHHQHHLQHHHQHHHFQHQHHPYPLQHHRCTKSVRRPYTFSVACFRCWKDGQVQCVTQMTYLCMARTRPSRMRDCVRS
ncbi:unnamed protein product [Gadus morhua 'NCC']